MTVDRAPDCEREVERLRKRVEHTEQWYAVRFERIRDEAKAAGIWPRIACIMANGTAEATEPPTYAQQMNVLRHEVERLRAENSRLHVAFTEQREALKRTDAALRSQAETYGD